MDDASALLDVRRMAEADSRSVAGGTTIAELMENAGRNVAREIERRWSPRTIAASPARASSDDAQTSVRITPRANRRAATAESLAPPHLARQRPDLARSCC